MKKTVVQALALAALAVLALAGCSNPSGGGGDGGSISHIVTFNVNGGDALSEGLDTRTVDDGAAIGTLPVPTREDHGFNGWFTQADGGTQYSATSTVTADITLYAHWLINAYTVTFDVNGGDSLGTESTRAVSHGTAIGTLPVPTRADYSFAGWFTEAEDGTQYSDPSATVTEAFTLYAHWNINTYTVTFDVNEGDSLGEESTRTVDHGAAIGALPVPTRANYGFDGWFTEDGETPYSDDLTVTADITLYAHWLINAYTVTFEVNDGDPLGEGQDTRAVSHGAAIGTLPVPTRTNYGFDGWFTEDGGTQYSDISTVTATLILYAHWTIDAYTVTFDVNDGDPLGAESIRAVSHGTAIGTLPVPTRTGYGFDGWFTQADGGTPYSDASTVTATLTLYAHWTINTYTVTFNVNGGDPLGGGQDTRAVSHGAAIGALPEPTRTNYGFDGWFTEDGGTRYNADSTVTATLTLYAKWTIKTYIVTFNVNGGNSLGAEGTRTVDHGAAVGTLPVPTRTNYDFVGWFTEGGTQYSAASTVTAALALYAHWSPITVWDGSSIANGFAGGGGSSVADPYIISAAAELAYLARQVNNGTNYIGKYFTLTGDLDLNGKAWTAIGTTSVRSFRGSFDGDGHVIFGLAINKSGADYQGLFGFLDGAGVSNLGLEDISITGRANVGGIAGNVTNNGSIENCYSTGTMSGSDGLVGGIAGNVSSSSRIENCYSTGTVSGGRGGGIAGNVTTGSSVENCYSTGTVGGSLEVGGIAGYVNNGSIENCYTTGAVNGGNTIGGIVGAVSGGSIENCYSTGTVNGVNVIGGIAGRVSDSSRIENCYSTGAVSGIQDGGGIAGYVNSGSSVENCYSTGTVSRSRGGGIAGYVNSGNIENCAALNPTVSGVGRVVGPIGSSGTNTFTGNVAWDGMTVTGGTVTNNSDKDGQGISTAQVKNGTGLPAGFKSNPWTYTTGKLPILGGLAGQSNALPAHLQ